MFVCSDYIGYDAPSKFFNSLMNYDKHPELLGYIIFQANSTEPHSQARSLNGYSTSQRRTMIAEAKRDPSKFFDWLMSHGHGLIGLRHNGDMQVAWRLINHLRTIASRYVFMCALCFTLLCFDYLYFCGSCLIREKKGYVTHGTTLLSH